MKQRFKNWITSLIGIAVMIGAICWKFVPSVAILIEYKASMVEFVTLLFVGWVFLSAKDSLIEGVLGGIIKIKPKAEDKSEEEN